MENFFSESKENINQFFKIHFLSKVSSIFLLPGNSRKQKNILYVVCGTRSM